MTPPTVIFFGRDVISLDDREPPAKVVLRTLLYATAKRGRIVENMYVRLRRGESSQTFNCWAHGDDSIALGSGVFVGENGLVSYHNFYTPVDATKYDFTAGEYVLEVYATLAGSISTLKLFSVNLFVSAELADRLKDQGNGIVFVWGPDSQRYHPSVSTGPKRELPPFLMGIPR